ncbi:hypothetical protein RCH21_003337 [Arthrobacter sp. PL16]|uniref:hypothetical protein n=1 Tax=Arthrobacter sp. PL16 TaxID=3071720 RepID=UPI002E0492FF|nr:hypothetical protein [Arthrobacter sp. PL16]
MKALTHAPHDLVVATIDNIDVCFSGAELGAAPGFVGLNAGEPSLHLNLSAVRGAETATKDAQFLQQREDWAARLRAEGRDGVGHPPLMPGVALYKRITVQVSDDLGTEYERAGGQVAGDGTEWQALWVYIPAPPDNAQTLRLRFEVDDKQTGKHCELSL